MASHETSDETSDPVDDYLERILTARVYDVAIETPLDHAANLSRRLQSQVFLKREDLQPVSSFKLFEDTRSILEPAGALATAGAKVWLGREGNAGKTVVVVASGANMNFDRLRFVAERAELGEDREAVLAVTIPERPGSFREFCGLLGGRNITEFNYRLRETNLAHIFVGVAIATRQEATHLVDALGKNGLPALDLTDNEMAKSHVRHMVSGHSPHAQNERIYRFVFPERPGALLRFLENLRSGWNISLFHYRNHGSDFGRVLVGMQVPPNESEAFAQFLSRVGYDAVEETNNPVYRLFLG